MKNNLQEIRFDKDTRDSIKTLIELIRLLLEQEYVKTKMKIHTQQRKNKIEEYSISLLQELKELENTE